MKVGREYHEIEPPEFGNHPQITANGLLKNMQDFIQAAARYAAEKRYEINDV